MISSGMPHLTVQLPARMHLRDGRTADIGNIILNREIWTISSEIFSGICSTVKTVKKVVPAAAAFQEAFITEAMAMADLKTVFTEEVFRRIASAAGAGISRRR